MCTRECRRFVERQLTSQDVAGKSVLEVGALDVNGSTRELVLRFSPSKYVGVDIQAGPGVDVVCDVTKLSERFGEGSFDVVLTTEMMEHVEPWREAIVNLKRVLRPGGVLVLTTRSKGFGFHGYPYDFWRYEPEDIRVLLGDLDIEALERDSPDQPGVFVKARQPLVARELEVPLDAYGLYSIVLNRRALKVSPLAKAAVRIATPAWYAVKGSLPPALVGRLKSLTGRGGVDPFASTRRTND